MQITSSGTDTMINALYILMYSNMSIIRTFEVDSIIIRIKRENCSLRSQNIWNSNFSVDSLIFGKPDCLQIFFLILPFQFLFLLFHFFNILPCPRSSVQCWTEVVRVDNHTLFSMSERRQLVLHSQLTLLAVGITWRKIDVCQNVFMFLLRQSYSFFSLICEYSELIDFCVTRKIPTWSWCINLLICYWIWCANFVSRTFVFKFTDFVLS